MPHNVITTAALHGLGLGDATGIRGHEADQGKGLSYVSWDVRGWEAAPELIWRTIGATKAASRVRSVWVGKKRRGKEATRRTP